MSATSQNKDKRIAICGGGLVGCLAACYFAQREYDVILYEYRSDIRKAEIVSGRSINMAMSVRGRAAIRGVGAEESICSKGIEMYSRLIHDTKGNTNTVPYGKSNQCILSIDRRFLNELLLTEAEKHSNVKVVFNHKLIKCNTVTGDLEFENTETKERVMETCDLIVGCDGSYSVARQCVAKEVPMNYLQEYNAGWYSELCIPAKPNGDYAMPPNHLHIWPRGEFMLIALPNQDRSFTVTVFMPKEMYDVLTNETEVLAFFEKYFVDAMNLIGKEELVRSFFNNKPSPLISIKCSPHNGTKCLLIGDSVHSMVPFYGQGMNAAFEDCSVFFDLLDKHGFDNISTVLKKYTEVRVPDAQAICDLAFNNYYEMRYLCTTRKYKMRKIFDMFLNKFLPNTWIPLYSMVTFSRIRYSEVIKRRDAQDKIVSYLAPIGSICALGMVSLGAMKVYKIFKQ